jgi:RNA polymerase sigma-70 factor, ECF subfamily
MEPISAEVTRLLNKWQAGDPNAAANLMPLVYSELKRIAKRFMGRERPDHTLQPTALVHEAFLQLRDAKIPWQDRAHFIAVCARAMRRILVDHARARYTEKRGGGAVEVDVDVALAVAKAPSAESTVIALDEALQKLASSDERKASVIELHYFGGLKQSEIAAVLSISVATVERELKAAKQWLRAQIA